MPRAYGLRVLVGGGMAYMLDVEAGVGQYAANKRLDVMLVQYLLQVWASRGLSDPVQRPIIMDSPIVATDGICGPKTIGAIRSFEKAFPQTAPDGKVDPFSTPNSRISKIFTLNQLLFFEGGLRGGVPVVGPRFPDALIPPLFRP